MLGKFLAAASKLGLKVLVGLMLVPMPDADVASIGKLYVELVTDLYSGYGHNAAFGGYYLTQEWGWREGDFEQVKLNTAHWPCPPCPPCPPASLGGAGGVHRRANRGRGWIL